MSFCYRNYISCSVLMINFLLFACYLYSNFSPNFSDSDGYVIGKERMLIKSDSKKTDDFRVHILEKNLAAIPQWLRDYISWHSTQRKYYLDDPSTKFLTVACHNPGFCGGIADRLKSIPYFIEVANTTRRVLFIKWQKYNLEDFLLPLEGGLDWRLPDGIDIGQDADTKSWEITEVLDNPKHPLNEKRNLVVRSNTHMYKPENFLTEQKPTGMGSYANIMELMFIPTRPLAIEIKKSMDSLGLIAKQYVAAHYRAKDYESVVNDKSVSEMHRAIDCAVQAVGGDINVPIYFAASNSNFVKYMLNDSPYAQSRSPPVRVLGLDNVVRVHSDKSILGYNDPRDLYPAFVDLWLLKYSKCVAHGHLGFGKFGSYLNEEGCAISHIHHSTKCPSVLR